MARSGRIAEFISVQANAEDLADPRRKATQSTNHCAVYVLLVLLQQQMPVRFNCRINT